MLNLSSLLLLCISSRSGFFAEAPCSSALIQELGPSVWYGSCMLIFDVTRVSVVCGISMGIWGWWSRQQALLSIVVLAPRKIDVFKDLTHALLDSSDNCMAYQMCSTRENGGVVRICTVWIECDALWRAWWAYIITWPRRLLRRRFKGVQQR